MSTDGLILCSGGLYVVLQAQLDQKDRSIQRKHAQAGTMQRQLDSLRQQISRLHATWRTAEGPLLQTYALNPHTPIAPMPALTASTSMDQDHPAETLDQPCVTCPAGPRPCFMTELGKKTGSGTYFRAYVIEQSEKDVTLTFPGVMTGQL